MKSAPSLPRGQDLWTNLASKVGTGRAWGLILLYGMRVRRRASDFQNSGLGFCS